MAMPKESELIPIITPALEAAGLDLEGLKITRAGAHSQVTIAVDGDTRPDLDALEALSRNVSDLFDAAEAAGTIKFGGQGYNLELTTMGVGAPLTAPRHFRRNRGRLVKLPSGDLQRLGAVSADESQVVLISPKGATQLAELGAIGGAVVEVEFATLSDEQAALVAKDFSDFEV